MGTQIHYIIFVLVNVTIAIIVYSLYTEYQAEKEAFNAQVVAAKILTKRLDCDNKTAVHEANAESVCIEAHKLLSHTRDHTVEWIATATRRTYEKILPIEVRSIPVTLLIICIGVPFILLGYLLDRCAHNQALRIHREILPEHHLRQE